MTDQTNTFNKNMEQGVKQQTTTGQPPMDPMRMIQQTTGLDLGSMLHPDQRNGTSDVQRAPEVPTASKKTFLTPDELRQLSDGPQVEEKIDVSTEIDSNRNQRLNNMMQQKTDKDMQMFNEVLQEEENRAERLVGILDDPDAKKELFRGTPNERPVVQYQAPIGRQIPVEDAADPQTQNDTKQAEMYDISDDTFNFPATDINEDDLVPSYDYDTSEEEATADDPTEDQARPKANDSTAAYAEYVRNLTTVETPEIADSVIETVKPKITIVPVSNTKNSGPLGDQAFMNAINKFKKDNFSTVSVPLVNSGFMASVVGTGAVDLNLLYSAVDQNTLAVDYELEKMRVMIRSIVETTPIIDKNDLRNKIHFADYQMLSYAHICATLKSVELIQTCTECGKDFHITAQSNDLLLNMDEMREQKEKIMNAHDIREISLIAMGWKVTTSSGFTINLAHPSYADYIRYLSEMKTFMENAAKSDAVRISRLAEILPFIRSIILPNNVHTSSVYQKYLAIGLLSEDEYSEMLNEIKKMSSKIIIPKFGIRTVVCPHCGKENVNITYKDLDELLFFHFTVTRWMNNIEE